MGPDPFSKNLPHSLRRYRRVLLALAALAVLSTAAGAGPLLAATGGDYTENQANTGQQVYAQNCATCHGNQLQGGAGPALAGSQFADNLNYSKITAQQLFDFIKTQMPNNAPGSLSEQQYLDAFAYILSKNGYPAGSTPLSQKTLGQVHLLPYPGANSNRQGGSATSSR